MNELHTTLTETKAKLTKQLEAARSKFFEAKIAVKQLEKAINNIDNQLKDLAEPKATQA